MMAHGLQAPPFLPPPYCPPPQQPGQGEGGMTGKAAYVLECRLWEGEPLG